MLSLCLGMQGVGPAPVWGATISGGAVSASSYRQPCLKCTITFSVAMRGWGWRLCGDRIVSDGTASVPCPLSMSPIC